MQPHARFVQLMAATRLRINKWSTGHENPYRGTVVVYFALGSRAEGRCVTGFARTGAPFSNSIVTTVTRMTVFNTLRQMLRDAMDTGAAEQIGLAREFIVTVPAGGETKQRNARRPYSDGVARALADEDNLRQFAHVYDPHDLGLRDMWEIVVTTGRRVREVVQVRWDCLGRYNGLPMFWHDQTKVGNYDVAIRIPERLYDVIAERQTKTQDRFTAHHGRRPAGAERAGLALFATTHRNHDGTQALSYNWFHTRFQAWITALDLGHCVPHQARHTLATNLLRAGASLTHIRTYLGHVSDRMAEHYVHLSNSDLEDVLQQVGCRTWHCQPW